MYVGFFFAQTLAHIKKKLYLCSGFKILLLFNNYKIIKR